MYYAAVNDTLNCSLSQPLFDAYHELQLTCLDYPQFSAMIANASETFNVVLNVTEINCTRLDLAPVLTEFFGSVPVCLDESSFIAEINMIAIYFVISASAMFFFGYIQISTFQVSSERQVFKMRLAYYSSVLRQDIGWFDVNPSGGVSSRLAE